MEKGTFVTPVTFVLEVTRTASPVTSVEEITPHPKRQRVADKGKEKADPRSSSVLDNASLALTRAQDAFTIEELKVLSTMPSNEIVGHHIHKLVQVMYLYNLPSPSLFFCMSLKVGSSFQVLGETIHITSEYLSKETKATFVGSKVQVLKAKNLKLSKDLISAMDKVNTSKEKAKVLFDNLKAERQLTLEKDEQQQAAKERVKTIAAKSVEAFQQTNEYNTVLFSWYYKGFELLQRYLVNYPIGMDLESLDLEVVDKKMAVDEAAQSATIALEENASELTQAGGDKVDA